jgi:hypothetical protein
MYFRQHGDCWGIGSYQHEPLLVDPDNILPYAEAPVMPSVQPFTEEHFGLAWASTTELFPSRSQKRRAALQNQRHVFLHARQRFRHWRIDEGPGLLGGRGGVGHPRGWRRQNRRGTHDHRRSQPRHP